MKTQFIFLVLFFVLALIPKLYAQSGFSVDAYNQFLSATQNLDTDELTTMFPTTNPYYSNVNSRLQPGDAAFLDSIMIKYNLTDDEFALLKQNNFMVSERLGFDTFGEALHDIYHKDLPVFVTTDAILQALHASYDQILMDVEIMILEPDLYRILEGLANAMPALINKYGGNPELQAAIGDVDLYTAVALSLLKTEKIRPQSAYSSGYDAIMTAIAAEQYVELPLFSERNRKLDFSQYTVRGHYTIEFYDESGQRTLGNYFKAMMWLGREDFMLTPPPLNPAEAPWTREEIQRMNLGAFMLNELIGMAGVEPEMAQIDEIITFMVGESDNLTPAELSGILSGQSISSAEQLLDDNTYDAFITALKASSGSGQQILSTVMIMDPFDPEPGELPVSYRLMGQRFIIDSYVFSNLVYDRVVYNGSKIWRPMPDPMDAMFVLGNDNALPLLKSELDTYHYSSQMAALRYLVDSYDDSFWDMSLYNVWLNSLRTLNPTQNLSNYPMFMQTSAWQQLKLNTQLASWAELRHDNLLYAKQSYTGGTSCSYPYSYIEPYPAFYGQIAAFAEKAENYFSTFSNMDYRMFQIKGYFPRLKNTARKLEILAQKEVDNVPFTTEDKDFLGKMLFVEGGSGAPPFSGWYAELYYIMEHAAEGDFVIADVHTQPTDEFGNMVGNVMHVAVGRVNLGVFITESPATGGNPTAYVGPVMSYYEKETSDFKRMTDEEWTSQVEGGKEPARPDWVNVYMADKQGDKYPEGRQIPHFIINSVDSKDAVHLTYALEQNYPNPFNPATVINYSIEKAGKVRLTIYDILGRQVQELVNESQQAGVYSVQWDAAAMANGIYFYRLESGSMSITRKMTLLK